MSKQHIVIIGGGFGGIKAALELAGDPLFTITLISSHRDFYIYSTLYRVATGGSMRMAHIPLDEVFEGKQVHVITDTVTELNREDRTVTTASQRTFGYDSLICALGSQTNYFGVKGLDTYSFGIKTPDQTAKLKYHLHQQLVERGEADLNYVVVGGGPTGVELAGALPSYIRTISRQHGVPERKVQVTLLEASARVLPQMPRDISFVVARRLKRGGVRVRTRQAVHSQTADALLIDGKPIPSHTVIWTAGTTNNRFFAAHQFQRAANGKVRVDQFLQAEPDIYVIGDNADTPYSGMAQTALRDGVFVAHNLKRVVRGEDRRPYQAAKPIYVVPAGRRWAAVLWGKFRIYGRIGWWLRRMADFIAYHDYEPWHKAVKQWLAEEKEEDCTVCRER